jgi:hypothetical protein
VPEAGPLPSEAHLAPASVAELTEEMSSTPRRSSLAISEDATIEPLTVVTERQSSQASSKRNPPDANYFGEESAVLRATHERPYSTAVSERRGGIIQNEDSMAAAFT